MARHPPGPDRRRRVLQPAARRRRAARHLRRHELADGAAFLFKTRPLELDEKASALLTGEARELLARISERLHSESDWTVPTLEANLKTFAEEQGLGLGKLAQPMRAALTGTTTSPGIFDVLALLGREEALARLDAQAASADADHTA